MFKNCDGLIVIYCYIYQYGCCFVVYIKSICCMVYCNCVMQIVFGVIVQLDILFEIQWLFIDGFGDESGVNCFCFFQMCSVQCLKSQQIVGDDIQCQYFVVEFQLFILFFVYQ